MSRSFKLRVRLPSTDGKKKKWVPVDEPISVEAASLDELCTVLHAALLGLGRIDASSTVGIAGVFDEDEKDWLELEQATLDEIGDTAELRLTVASPPHATVASPPQPTVRHFVLQLWLSTADGAWARLEPELKVAAASLHDIVPGMRAHLVAAGKLTTASPAVSIDSVWRTDGFDEEWAAVSTIDDIPDRARLRILVPLDPSAAPPHALAYDDASFIVGEPRSISPIARDATGAVVGLNPASVVSFRLQYYAALAKWLTIDERTGELRGTPTQKCSVPDAEVLVTFATGQFRVCHVTVQADTPTDSRCPPPPPPFFFFGGGGGVVENVEPPSQRFFCRFEHLWHHAKHVWPMTAGG